MIVQFQGDFEEQNKGLEFIASYFSAHGYETTFDLDKEADVGIYASSGTRRNAKICFDVNHGIGNKGWHWCKADIHDMHEKERRNINLVPNKLVADFLTNNGCQAHIVGVPYMDMAYYVPIINKNGVFYCPTHNHELCSLWYIGPRIYDLGETTFKVHPMLNSRFPVVMDMFKNSYDGFACTGIAENAITVCDYASCALEAVMLNRPVIVFELGCYRYSNLFLPNSLEWRFRNAYYQAESWDDVKRYVQMLRNGNDPLADIRKKASEVLVEYPGHSRRRILEVVENIAKEQL